MRKQTRATINVGKQVIGPDGCPRWLSLDDLAHELGLNVPGGLDEDAERKLRQKHRHAVTQRLARIQKRFREEKLNPHWIGRDRKKGVRLLLRRVSPKSSGHGLTG